MSEENLDEITEEARQEDELALGGGLLATGNGKVHALLDEFRRCKSMLLDAKVANLATLAAEAKDALIYRFAELYPDELYDIVWELQADRLIADVEEARQDAMASDYYDDYREDP